MEAINMADESILLNNYSDDSQIKKFMSEELAPRVFHDIPLNVLNSGFFSLTSEYISQITEQLSYTSSFYFNESFITKAVLPDSIYAEAAIFNIGYSFATPASCNFLLELKIEDIHANAEFNADNGLYEFILDKNTKFNLPEGFVYSLDYDILIQYKDVKTSTRESSIPAWNVQYINRNDANVCATNKNIYLTYRVTDVWLCILIQANEYERQTHTVVNNMSGGIPNEDKVIMCDNHIAGFDIKYIDSNGNGQFLPRDHILTMHDSVNDNNPYVHYIMDNPQTIRFMWQLNGNKYFVPETNSSFEITIYTCHGKSANAPNYKNDEQPRVLTSSNKYSNNANVMKAVFAISGCVGGTDIGTTETVRRETIEAYNTANVLSTDHDIDEWFKTFYFKNILYPYFFKRRDDPWGRIWSGYIALNNDYDQLYKTNTLHGKLSYDELYNNADNSISNNEIIIPPGWVWVYSTENNWTVVPYTKGDEYTIESVNTLASISDKFVFANPFGLRIQKNPFAIGYFNPWVNQYVTASKINQSTVVNIVDNNYEDVSTIYHATPIITNIKRTYKDDYYKFTSHILPNIPGMTDGRSLIEYMQINAIKPEFNPSTWNYFKKPLDMYSSDIPMIPLNKSNGYIPFNPEITFLCVKTKDRISEEMWKLSNVWIEDNTTEDTKNIDISITAEKIYLYGMNDVWGTPNGYEVYSSGDTDIEIYPALTESDLLTFTRIKTQNYYELRLNEKAPQGSIKRIVVGEACETELTKYGESNLVKIGKSYSSNIYINVYYWEENENGELFEKHVLYTIKNAANVYMPYNWNESESGNGSYQFDMENIGANGIILYADMKPSPESGSVEYYRIPFSQLNINEAMFYIHSEQLPLKQNNLRVLMHTIVNGSETGRVEMQPVLLESDGSYRFESAMYPLTELIDIDNRINIASIGNGGGSWQPINGDVVSIDASDPQIKITILVKSDNDKRDSEITGDNGNFVGFRIVDEYILDDVDLVQELKEMRSVVKFGDSSIPTEEQINLYKEMYSLGQYNYNDPYNIYYLTSYAYNKLHGIEDVDGFEDSSFNKFQSVCYSMQYELSELLKDYCVIVSTDKLEWFDVLISTLIDMSEYHGNNPDDDIDWNNIYSILSSYQDNVNHSFIDKGVNVTGQVEIQLMPFVEYSLMLSDDFENFVSSFTQIHKAIEPVIFKRLEGNNYLDCKLIATYGLPHSYSSDIDINDPHRFWPDLNIQIEFDVKLYNQSLATNTINDLRNMVKQYFNRITGIHTPIDVISMDNNIYISHVIKIMETHENVAWMKFKGWYTNEKGKSGGNYMDANTQAIVQKWKKLEDMPKQELERYTPEMFVMEDDNIIINIIK